MGVTPHPYGRGCVVYRVSQGSRKITEGSRVSGHSAAVYPKPQGSRPTTDRSDLCAGILGENVPTTDGHWVGREVLDTLGVPEHEDALRAYLEEVESEKVPALRPPWARPGWFGAATDWIEEHIEKLGYKLTLPVECVKSWGISCVLKAHSTGGGFFSKGVIYSAAVCRRTGTYGGFGNPVSEPHS